MLPLLLFLFGCAPYASPGARAIPPQPSAEHTYREIFDAHTREVALYHQLDTQLIAKVTWLSPALQQAWLDEYIRVHQPTPNSLKNYQQLMAARWGSELSLLIQLDSRHAAMARLEDSDPLWRVQVFTANGEPLEVLSTHWLKSPTSVEHHFIPYSEDFGRLYLVRVASCCDFNAPMKPVPLLPSQRPQPLLPATAAAKPPPEAPPPDATIATPLSIVEEPPATPTPQPLSHTPVAVGWAGTNILALPQIVCQSSSLPREGPLKLRITGVLGTLEAEWPAPAPTRAH